MPTKEVKKTAQKEKTQEVSLPAYEKTNRSLKYLLFNGGFNAAMDGFGKAYISAFAIALKASNTMIGAIASLPELIGALFQLFAAKIEESARSRKNVVALLSVFQALAWLPILLVPYISISYGPMMLLFFITIMSTFSYVLTPIWNSLAGDIVPEGSRGRYFGKRNNIVGIVSFVATFIAGYTLNAFPPGVFYGFIIIFAMALISKLFSAYYLSKLYEPEFKIDKKAAFSFVDFIKRLRRSDNNYGKFVTYHSLMSFFVFIAAPFFALYLLRDLRFSYVQFTIIILSSVVGSIAAMNFWGKRIDASGSRNVLFICGMLIPFMPLLLVLSTNFYYLVLIEFFSGAAWAGFDLSSSNFIFDATTAQKRTRCISYFKVINGSAIFLGAMLGSFISNNIGSWFFISTIPILFIISGVLRLLTSVVFAPSIKDMRFIDVPLSHKFFGTHLTIQTRSTNSFETIGTYEREKKEKKELLRTAAEKKIKDVQQIYAEMNDAEKTRVKEQFLKFIEEGQKKGKNK